MPRLSTAKGGGMFRLNGRRAKYGTGQESGPGEGKVLWCFPVGKGRIDLTERLCQPTCRLPCRLLVADVDGTLTEGGAPIPSPLAQRLAEFRERGGLFTLATGRCPEAARPYLEQLAVNLPAILMNGALLFDPVSGQSLEEHYLDRPLVAHLLDWLADTRPDALVYQDREVLVHRVTPAIAQHLVKDGTRCREVAEWRAVDPEKVFKVLIIAPRCPASLFTGRYREMGESIHWVNSEPTYWEVLPEGVSKGSALVALCRRLGLAPDEVAAVGDGLNDLEMLGRAGLGVAVANAPAGLKSTAARVTTARSSQGVLELLDSILGTP